MATDDFNRADNADLGVNWDVQTGETAFKIVSNRALPTAISSDASERYVGVAFANDQSSQATLAAGAGGLGSTVGEGIGVLVRSSASARTFYRTVVSTAGSEIAKFVAGTYTQLTTNGTAWAATDVVFLFRGGHDPPG